MGDNYLTMFCWFLPYNSVNQPCVMYVCEVSQSCPTLCNPMDCSLPGSSVHGIFQATVLEWVAISFLQGIFPTQGLNPGLPPCFNHLSHQGSHSNSATYQLCDWGASSLTCLSF